MLLTEYNEAEIHELFKEDGRREGRMEGKAELRSEQQEVYGWLFKNGRVADVEKAIQDEDYYETLLQEYKKIYKP